MTLKARIALALLVPILTAVGLLGFMIHERAGELAAIDDLGGVVELAERASSLIHELQIERGLSVGYITVGRGEAQLGRLLAQRDVVDGERERFAAFLSGGGIKEAIPDLAGALSGIEARIAEIPDFRATVTD